MSKILQKDYPPTQFRMVISDISSTGKKLYESMQKLSERAGLNFNIDFEKNLKETVKTTSPRAFHQLVLFRLESIKSVAC